MASEPVVNGGKSLEQRESEDLEVLDEFPVLNRWVGNGYKASLVPRIVKSRAGVFFDLREYTQGTQYTGFTRRGLRLKISDIHGLMEQMPEIERRLIARMQEMRDKK